jgi:hypothetical protein
LHFGDSAKMPCHLESALSFHYCCREKPLRAANISPNAILSDAFFAPDGEGPKHFRSAHASTASGKAGELPYGL